MKYGFMTLLAFHHLVLGTLPAFGSPTAPTPPTFKWMEKVSMVNDMAAPILPPFVDSTGHLYKFNEYSSSFSISKYQLDGKEESRVPVKLPPNFDPIRVGIFEDQVYILGEYYTSGVTNGDIGLLHLSSSGQVLSTGKVTIPSQLGEIISLTVDPRDGGSAALVNRYFNGNYQLSVLRFDIHGQLEWEHDFNNATDVPDIYPSALKFGENGVLYLSYTYINENDDWLSPVIAFSRASGILWERTVKLHCPPSPHGKYFSIFEGLEIDGKGDISVLNSYFKKMNKSNLTKFHSDGSIVWTKDLPTGFFYDQFDAQLHLDPSDGLVVSGRKNRVLDMIRVDSAGKATWEMIPPSSTQLKTMGDIRISDNGYIWAIGSSNIPHRPTPEMADVVMDKISSDGQWLGERIWTPPTAQHPTHPSSFEYATDLIDGHLYKGGIIVPPPNNGTGNQEYWLMELNLDW